MMLIRRGARGDPRRPAPVELAKRPQGEQTTERCRGCSADLKERFRTKTSGIFEQNQAYADGLKALPVRPRHLL